MKRETAQRGSWSVKVKCCYCDELDRGDRIIHQLKFRVGSERGNEAPAAEIFSFNPKNALGKIDSNCTIIKFLLINILFSGVPLVTTTLRPIEVVWGRMSGIPQRWSPRAAIYVPSLRTSTPCHRHWVTRKAPRVTLYGTKYSALCQTACTSRAKRKIWSTAGQRVRL